jgi:starvation-inducible DNA-binding protein
VGRTRKEIIMIDELKVALANHIESALIVWGYHWNVEGIDFNQYHSFFGEIYSEYFDQVDTLAEYVRIISKAEEYVNASVDVVKANKTVKSNVIVGSKPKEMCAAILVLNSVLLEDLTILFKLATTAGEQGLANYCAGQMKSFGGNFLP